MRRSIILCVVVAVGGAFASATFAQISQISWSQSVSITLRGITESKAAPYANLLNFNESVQDSYPTENASSQQISSVTAPMFMSPGADVSVGGSVSFQITAPLDEMETSSAFLMTFTLDSPATFSLTENSNLESAPLGGDGEVEFPGGQLYVGSTVNPPSIIPNIDTLWLQQGRLTGNPPLTYSGTLAPGTYTYDASAFGNGDIYEGGSVTYGTDFQLSPVPEPVALPLLGMAALAMLRRRGRATRASSLIATL
ncbi:MAG TPA: hypothetical protein VK797_20255 [Tepidisphaeraceae bacterium]|jgi:hypothetical protein|nr:hypothetical protein [Tepidisphaeraceae bacterium]